MQRTLLVIIHARQLFKQPSERNAEVEWFTDDWRPISPSLQDSSMFRVGDKWWLFLIIEQIRDVHDLIHEFAYV